MNTRIEFKGQGKIIKSSWDVSKNSNTQNWWYLEIESGKTSFVLIVPTIRSTSATVFNKNRFCAGNVIEFVCTPDGYRMFALAITNVISHNQSRFDFKEVS